jgi:hypothetical protein
MVNNNQRITEQSISEKQAALDKIQEDLHKIKMIRIPDQENLDIKISELVTTHLSNDCDYKNNEKKELLHAFNEYKKTLKNWKESVTHLTSTGSEIEGNVLNAKKQFDLLQPHGLFSNFKSLLKRIKQIFSSKSRLNPKKEYDQLYSNINAQKIHFDKLCSEVIKNESHFKEALGELDSLINKDKNYLNNKKYLKVIGDWKKASNIYQRIIEEILPNSKPNQKHSQEITELLEEIQSKHKVFQYRYKEILEYKRPLSDDEDSDFISTLSYKLIEEGWLGDFSLPAVALKDRLRDAVRMDEVIRQDFSDVLASIDCTLEKGEKLVKEVKGNDNPLQNELIDQISKSSVQLQEYRGEITKLWENWHVPPDPIEKKIFQSSEVQETLKTLQEEVAKIQQAIDQKKATIDRLLRTERALSETKREISDLSKKWTADSAFFNRYIQDPANGGKPTSTQIIMSRMKAKEETGALLTNLKYQFNLALAFLVASKNEIDRLQGLYTPKLEMKQLQNLPTEEAEQKILELKQGVELQKNKLADLNKGIEKAYESELAAYKAELERPNVVQTNYINNLTAVQADLDQTFGVWTNELESILLRIPGRDPRRSSDQGPLIREKPLHRIIREGIDDIVKFKNQLNKLSADSIVLSDDNYVKLEKLDKKIQELDQIKKEIRKIKQVIENARNTP